MTRKTSGHEVKYLIGANGEEIHGNRDKEETNKLDSEAEEMVNERNSLFSAPEPTAYSSLKAETNFLQINESTHFFLQTNTAERNTTCCTSLTV